MGAFGFVSRERALVRRLPFIARKSSCHLIFFSSSIYSTWIICVSCLGVTFASIRLLGFYNWHALRSRRSRYSFQYPSPHLSLPFDWHAGTFTALG